MKLIGIVRLGRDAEVRYTPNGFAVCEFSGAFNYGPKPDEGHRPTQWVDFKMWGDRGEKLAPHLLKGQAVLVDASDAHIETYAGRDGSTHAKLVARVDTLEFAGPKPEGAEAPAPASAAAGAAARAPAPKAAAARSRTGFDDMDDDIPF